MKTKICLIQDNPVFFDIDKTIDKVEILVSKYASKGAQLIVFPESFIPGYPRGFSFGATIGKRTEEGKQLYNEYYKNSIEIASKEMGRLERIAKEAGVYLVIGATEKLNNNGSLYCSMLYVSPSKGLLGVHRKIKPTGTERLIWAEADGESLVTFDTNIGKMGGLICWENYMPLARMSMYSKGIEIYIAPTADAREEWISTMQHIALEGRCFVLGCNQYFTKSMYPNKYRQMLGDEDVLCRGGSVVISPYGKIIGGPLYDKSGNIFVEIDMEDVVRSKLDFDVNGHYNRNDIFNFKVRGMPSMKKEID